MEHAGIRYRRSVTLVFLPIYYTGSNFGDSVVIFRPFLMALHNALRIFLIDCDFESFKDMLSDFGGFSHAALSLYMMLLCVIAPVLTFGNVLSLFDNIRNELRFVLCRKRSFYLFSELNSKSLSLAKSIAERRSGTKPLIVFTDAVSKDKEEEYELFQKASDLNAVILKKDITRVQIGKKRGSAEFFLIGENKSENMEQALCVIERVKSIEKMRVSVYVYSSDECDGYILDSADKGERIYDNSIANDIKRDPVGFLKSTDFSHNALDSGFTVRRIDSIECLVQKTLAADKTLDALFSKKEKEISVLLLGMGDFGINFLKDALWLYQILGYSAKYTVFDMPKYENGRCLNIINRLGHEWPEIIDDTSKTRFVKNEVGNAVYDIQFFDGTDCFSSEFDKLFESGEAADRLRQTDLAVVCLGNDDKNIKASIMLRSIFDRVNRISNESLDSKDASHPLIYSLVYDETKTNVLNKNRLTNGLTNHYGQPLQIDFIGDLESQYRYETIEEQKQREVVALQYHLEWIRAGATDAVRQDKEQLRGCLLESLNKYIDYEYFRRSSVARALQEEVIKKITNAAGADMSCGTGGRSMLTSEHMRWNMYMRTIGYRYADTRADRAKMHPDLISVDKLNTAERKKDTPRKGV